MWPMDKIYNQYQEEPSKYTSQNHDWIFSFIAAYHESGSDTASSKSEPLCLMDYLLHQIICKKIPSILISINTSLIFNKNRFQRYRIALHERSEWLLCQCWDVFNAYTKIRNKIFLPKGYRIHLRCPVHKILQVIFLNAMQFRHKKILFGPKGLPFMPFEKLVSMAPTAIIASGQGQKVIKFTRKLVSKN
jgi:hypothetical protein